MTENARKRWAPAARAAEVRELALDLLTEAREYAAREVRQNRNPKTLEEQLMASVAMFALANRIARGVPANDSVPQLAAL